MRACPQRILPVFLSVMLCANRISVYAFLQSTLDLGQLPGTDFFFEQFYPGMNITLVQGTSLVDETLQLTSVPNSSGRAFYPDPIRFTHTLTGLNGTINIGCPFSTEFVFSIARGPEGATEVDGMAFFITSTTFRGDMENSAGSFLGLLNQSTIGNSESHTFAVEFDTFQNYQFGDINANHVGLNINNLVSSTVANADSEIDLKSGRKIHAWIDYSDAQKQIDVRIRPLDESSQMQKPEVALLSAQFDLSTVFQEFMYVGFSAGSGPSPGNPLYKVYSWSFSNHGPPRALPDDIPASGRLFLRKGLLIPICITVAAFILIAILAGIARAVVIRKNSDLIQMRFEDGPQRFSYKTLNKATKGFHKHQLLGKGGFGSVYRGILPVTNTPVAVKRISKESNQGSKEFLAEVSIIGRLRHRNLVPLIGWCNEKELLLVYELMPNGSVDKMIFNSNRAKVLPLFLRTKILTGVAAALVYLHEEWEQKVVHRDVKASNVLLDADFNARLGDFGLARLYDHRDMVPETTNIAGTWGYLAPDFCLTRKVSDKTDVYSFGILTLEVVCGRRVTDLMGEHQNSLLEWLRQMDSKGNLREAIDPRLDVGFDPVHATQLLQLGLVCSHPEPSFRPSMRRVLHALMGESPLSFSSCVQSYSFTCNTKPINLYFRSPTTPAPSVAPAPP